MCIRDSPHYDEEPERRPTVKKLIVSKKLKNVYAVDGGAALHIKNEKQFKSVVFKKYKSSYEVSLDKENFFETRFKKVSLL